MRLTCVFSLKQGSATLDTTLDPLAAGAQTHIPNNSGHCQHDEAFFSQANWEEIYNQQYAEYQARVWAAQEAAMQAAEGGGEGGEAPPPAPEGGGE